MGFENWKVWDNLMVIATDVAVFDDVIRSYNRILDLKDTHIDNEVLKILVKAVSDNLTDNSGTGAGRLLEKVKKLFGRLTGVMPREAGPWKLYSHLLSRQQNISEEDGVKSVQFM